MLTLCMDGQSCYDPLAVTSMAATPFGKAGLERGQVDLSRSRGSSLFQELPAGGAGVEKVVVAGGDVQISDRIRLGSTTYHLASERLVASDGAEIVLRWQSAQVLRLLADSLNVLVQRDDLIDDIWPDVAVTDDSLTQCIADIRRATGDQSHQILKTVRKRGYMLIGEALAEVAPAQVASPASEAAALADVKLPGPVVTAQLDPRDVFPTIAVLPLHNMSGGAVDPLGVFLADEISGALGRANDVNIISRLSTGTVLDRSEGLAGIGQQLNADFVLSGILMREGDSAVLSVEFADTENRFVLWSNRMKLRVDTLLSEVDWVEQIVINLRNAIMLNEVRRVQSRPPQDLKLFSLVHGAVGLMHRFERKDFNLAREYLEYVAAQVKSPTPLAWMARWHVLKTVQGWTDNPAAEAQTALGLTARALDMEPNHSLALVCEGHVLAHISQRLDEAEDRYDQALAANPNNAQGRALRGMLATFKDDGLSGKRDTERALHLTPLDPHRFFYLVLAAAANLTAGDPERAVVLARESWRMNRTHVSTLRTLVAAEAGSGDVEGARKTAKELLRLQPGLRVSEWMKASPSGDFKNGRMVADMLRLAGIPD